MKLDPLFHTTYAKMKDKKLTQSHKLNNGIKQIFEETISVKFSSFGDFFSKSQEVLIINLASLNIRTSAQEK